MLLFDVRGLVCESTRVVLKESILLYNVSSAISSIPWPVGGFCELLVEFRVVVC